jgi:hypothetical protein
LRRSAARLGPRAGRAWGSLSSGAGPAERRCTCATRRQIFGAAPRRRFFGTKRRLPRQSGVFVGSLRHACVRREALDAHMRVARRPAAAVARCPARTAAENSASEADFRRWPCRCTAARAESEPGSVSSALRAIRKPFFIARRPTPGRVCNPEQRA